MSLTSTGCWLKKGRIKVIIWKIQMEACRFIVALVIPIHVYTVTSKHWLLMTMWHFSLRWSPPGPRYWADTTQKTLKGLHSWSLTPAVKGGVWNCTPSCARLFDWLWRLLTRLLLHLIHIRLLHRANIKEKKRRVTRSLKLMHITIIIRRLKLPTPLFVSFFPVCCFFLSINEKLVKKNKH